MGLVLAFAGIAGAVLFLTAAVTGSSFGQVLSGQAMVNYRRGETTAQQRAASAATPTGTPSVGPGLTNLGLALGPGGGVNPFARATNLVLGRTDQGVDASMAPGSPIAAPFNSQYLGLEPNWYSGQPYIAFKITSGPYVGKVYYLAEQIIPANLSPGQTVPAGTQIATYAPTGTGIEMGWANPSNWRQTLAQATTGYAGVATQAGQDFHSLLLALGA